MFIFIVVVIVVLASLICYAFFTQTLEKKKKQHQRLVNALKVRSKDFSHMAEGFPPNFLPKELNVLIMRSLVDVLDQLVRLEPSEPQYAENLQQYKLKLQEAQTSSKTAPREKIQNPAQIAEVKQLLGALNNFLGIMLKRGTINSKEHVAYEEQIKLVIIEMNIDAHIINAKQAAGIGKAKLAIHYYSLAKKLMLKGNEQKDFRAQIMEINEKIAGLQSQLASEEAEQAVQISEATQPDKETEQAWEEFDNDEDEDWKKKSIYD